MLFNMSAWNMAGNNAVEPHYEHTGRSLSRPGKSSYAQPPLDSSTYNTQLVTFWAHDHHDLDFESAIVCMVSAVFVGCVDPCAFSRSETQAKCGHLTVRIVGYLSMTKINTKKKTWHSISI